MRKTNARRMSKKVRAALGAARKKEKKRQRERTASGIGKQGAGCQAIHRRQTARDGDAYVQ